MSNSLYDVAIIGGGIIGVSVANALLDARPSLRIVLLEAESHLGTHQTGHNSGVIHSGLYYKPGSLKAKLCAEGREAMYRFCREHGIAHERCGKIVVATREEELPRRSRAMPCRSEEHTSELSHVEISYAVFCLKKKI